MKPTLRQFLEQNNVIRTDAGHQDAWRAYRNLTGDLKKRAQAVKRGQPDPQNKQSNPNPQSQPASDGTPLDPQQARQAERQRQQSIRQLADLAGDAVDEQLIQRAIDEDWSVEQSQREFHAMYQRKSLKSDDNQPVSSGAPAAHTSRGVEFGTLAAGFAIRCGGDPISVGYEVQGARQQYATDEHKRNAERLANEGDRFRDVNMVDMARMALQASGEQPPIGARELVTRAVSTGSLQNVMEPALNARLMQRFNQATDTTTMFTREVDLPDFRTHERHQLGMATIPEKRLRGEHAQHNEIADRAPETYKPFEYADILKIDRQDIIDDRMEIFQEWPDRMGMAFARLRPLLVYYILLSNPNMADGNPLFSASHNNTVGSVFDKSTLETAVTTLRKQQQDGVNLDIRPNALIVNSDLEFDARNILNSAQLLTRGNTDDVIGANNTIAQLNMDLAVSPELVNGVTDPNTKNTASGSNTTWFLAANPNDAPLIEVGYVASLGRQPQTEVFTKTGDDGFFGIQYAASHAIAAKALDWRGLVRGNT